MLWICLLIVIYLGIIVPVFSYVWNEVVSGEEGNAADLSLCIAISASWPLFVPIAGIVAFLTGVLYLPMWPTAKLFRKSYIRKQQREQKERDEYEYYRHIKGVLEKRKW